MILYDSNLWRSDLDICIDLLPELDLLKGKNVMITGATGLVCSAVVYLIIRYNETHDEKIGLVVACRNQEKVIAKFGQYSERDFFSYFHYDALEYGFQTEIHVDYIIHGAANAYPGIIDKEPVETMLSNFMGMYSLLQYAHSHSVKRIVFISSSEIYGINEGDAPYLENDYGSIDILNARNSYSVSKCAAETLCVSFDREYKTQTVIVRPGHIYGPTASENDNRVSSAFAYSAARKQPLVLKSEGTQVRSYCYCADCATAVVKALLLGKSSTAYNVSNPESVISIRTMASVIASVSGVELSWDLPSEQEKRAFNPMENSSLDSSALISLGWKPCFDANAGLEHTVRILRECINNVP